MINQSEFLKALRLKGLPVDWDAVYESELPRVYNYFLYKVGDCDPAKDLTAITFVRAWKNRERYNPLLASPATWLLGIARNVLKEYLRREKATANKPLPLQDSEQLPSPLNVEQVYLEQQEKKLLRRLLLELPDRELDLIALKYGAGLTNREIARISGLSESNVGSILHRTVATLRRKWDGNHG